MKESDYISSGNELFVFRARKPDDLLGVHTELMARAIQPGEELLYMLYAPIFNVTGASMFGIQASPASHAVAVTGQRFLVSENRHISGIAPVLQSIPFSQIVCIEIGYALLWGWLAIHFVPSRGNPSCVSLFFTSLGIGHFAALIRAYRCIDQTQHMESMTGSGISWEDIWEQTPLSHLSLLQSLVFEQEIPLWFHRSQEAWQIGPKRRKQCLVTDGVSLLTTAGLLHSEDEPRISPEIIAYGVNVCCIPPGAMKRSRQP